MITSTNKPGWQMESGYAIGTLLHHVTRVITAKDITIDELLFLLEKHEVNICLVKPKDVFAAIKSETLKKVDLSNILYILSGGQHLSVKIAEEFQKYIPNGKVISMYGMSDVGVPVTTALQNESPKGSVGHLSVNMKLRVVDEQGKNVGPKELGEIYVKSNVPFAGYYKDEEKSKEALSSDGYFMTGDIGYVDENGFVFLVERKKFLISYGGHFLNQSEIEKIVLENVKGVEAVSVIDMEDEKYNMYPVITIIPEKGVKLNEQEIIEIVQKNSEHKFHTKVFFFDSLPITISGKYKKYVIRDMVKELMKK